MSASWSDDPPVMNDIITDSPVLKNISFEIAKVSEIMIASFITQIDHETQHSFIGLTKILVYPELL